MNPAERLFVFVLENAVHEPLTRRVSLYRDAAAILSGEAYAARLLALAAELEAIEAKHTQLFLNIGTPDA